MAGSVPEESYEAALPSGITYPARGGRRNERWMRRQELAALVALAVLFVGGSISWAVTGTRDRVVTESLPGGGRIVAHLDGRGTIEVTALSDLSAPIHAVRLELRGAALTAPAQLELRVPPSLSSGLSPSDLTLATRGASGQPWQIAGGHYDAHRHTLTITTRSLHDWAIVAR